MKAYTYTHIWILSGVQTLDLIKTRFESGLNLDKIKISVLKLITLKNRKLKSKILKNRKIKKIRKFELEKIKIKNYEILRFFKFLNFQFSHQFQIFSKFFEFFDFFELFEFNFQFFQNFTFKTEIWILSRLSPDWSLVPDQNLYIKKSRLWTQSGLVPIVDISVPNQIQ